MASLILTSLSDENNIFLRVKSPQLRYIISLLFILVISFPINSQVLINEVVTDPQQDWDGGGFTSTPGMGSATGGTDEWIELYIGADGLDLDGWLITVDDGSPFSGDLTNSGAFTVVNYIGTGSFNDTDEGDYLVLGNPISDGAMNNTGLTITLEDDSGPRVTIDQITIDGGSGTMFSGNSNDVTDEAISRIPNGTTTGVESVDFVKTRATIGANNSPSGSVLINEVVTNPRQDWSTNGFDGTIGGTTITEADEWIELYIDSDNLNLTKWSFTIQDSDGTLVGDLTAGGAFGIVNYIGMGDFTQTRVGDYLVLGDPENDDMNTEVYIQLFDSEGTLIDDVEIGDNEDIESDGIDGAPDSNGASIANESVARISNATDTDTDAVDFRRVVSTLGSENGIMNVFVDASASDDNGIGTVGDPKQLIQSGINLALSGGTVTVAGGSYSGSLNINKALTLNGPNQGVAGNGTRVAEASIDIAGAAITATSDAITIDGFQIGTAGNDSDVTNGIVVTGSDIGISNNIVYANRLGISAGGASSGTVNVSDNLVSMLAINDATNLNNGSVGIYFHSISGTADGDLIDNIISNASTGIIAYGLTSSTEAFIDGGSISGSTTGILPTNSDGIGGFSPSNLTIQNITMSGFDTDADVGGTETGVYVVTAGGTASDDITIVMENLDISGTGNDASNYAGIIVGDFGSDGAGIDATISNSNVYDNENRGIYTRGADATTSITQTVIAGNGFNPTAAGGNFGFSVIAREGSTTTISNCEITNPATLTNPEDVGAGYYVSGLSNSTGGSLSVSNSNLSDNGNGFIAETSGIDLSGNYFNNTDEATILSLVGSGNDFTPWLTSGTDTDGGTAGFQGDFSSLIVGESGDQTGSSGRIEEAISLIDAAGTINVNNGNYQESLTITKAVTLNGANQGLSGNDGGRGTESIIEPASASVGLTVGANDVTVDGFQFGTSNGASNHTTAILNAGFSGFTVNNNRVHANANGIIINGVASGTVSLSSNYVEMLGLANPLATTDPSLGIGILNISGDADVDAIGNDVINATYGIATFGLTSSITAEINGGAYNGCTIGISSSNFDGSSAFSASSLSISNVTMAGFTGPDGGITGAAGIPQAGIYAFTTVSAPSTDHDLTVTVDAADISEVTAGGTDYAAIYAGDFNNTDPDLEVSDDKGITMTVSNSTIYDNLNRGVHSRGADAIVNVNTSTISNNTNAGGVVFAKGTLNINNSYIALPPTGATSGVLAQTDGQIAANNSHFDLNGNAEPGTLIANIQDPSGDETIDLSGSWLTTTDQTAILALLDESDTDFSPWLGLGTDTNPGAIGFQPDRSSYYVGTGGSQSSGLLVEAHDLLLEDGEMTLTSDAYAETLNVTKSISMAPESGVSIDDLVLNGGNLSVMNNTITINNSLTMTEGIFDIDQEDGDKSDDPVFILPATVNGSSYGADTYFEGRVQSSVSAATSFTFHVGDEGAYRPAVLTPTNTTTFQVAHIEGATPTGAGLTNPTIGDLVGKTSAEPAGTIESVLNFRYWDIDIASGTPDATEVNLEISSVDNASDATSLGITRFDGSDWVFMTSVSASGTGPFVVTGTTSDFSEFSIYSTDALDNPLPVELIDFTGQIKAKLIQLSWSTLTEVNSDYFKVERSMDGIEFESIGEVTSNGNSSRRLDYQFIDEDIKSDVYYYRLKIVDFDGSYEYSPIILITPDLSNAEVLVYPNPASNYIQIEGLKEEYIEQVSFYDMNGQVQKLITGDRSNRFSIEDLAQGYYLIRLMLVDGKVLEGKLVKN